MKIQKIIIITFVSLLIILPTLSMAEDRQPKRLTMDDLTDPSSASYVLHPFPETREEIIANLKHQLSKLYSGNRWEKSITGYIDLLPELLKDKPGAVVTEIVKVKNRMSFMPYPYSYLIIVSDLKGKYTARVAMNATGLLASGADPSEGDPGIKLKKFSKVIEKLGRHFKKEDVKSIERMAYGIDFASTVHPIYEVTLNDGSKFFYDHRGKSYKEIEKKKFNGNMRKERASFVIRERKKLKNDEQYLFDWISQEFIILKKLN